jgi:hypothetical protein
MKAAAKLAKPEKSFREREHRYSALTVQEILRIRMEELGVKNVDLSSFLGYKMPNVIAMMKAGTMRLPANKAEDVARILQLEPTFFLMKVIAENDADLADVISRVMGRKMVSENEFNLLKFVREALKGFDVDLCSDKDFTQAVSPVLKSISEREDQVKKASIARIELAARPKAAA